MARQMKAVKLPSNEFALMNAVLVGAEEFPESERIEHLSIHSSGKDFVITLMRNDEMKAGEFALGDTQRKWANISVEAVYAVKPYKFQPTQYLACVTFQVDFHVLSKSVRTTAEVYDTDEMVRQFLEQFPVMALTKEQYLVFNFQKKPNLKLTVKAVTAVDLAAITDEQPMKSVESLNGVWLGSPNMEVFFERSETSSVNLTGKSMTTASRMSILKPGFDFQKMGIGGLDKDFSIIFRRTFASRLLPPNRIDQLGSKHVRGILLFGPPGTGKTLIARQIGKMLNSREPQIVSGPSVLDKFVGESEANIRKLFAPAEEEEKRLGRNSGLHIIIFDEIDAICKQRGSASGSTGVHDNIVNQLLAKMDGVDQLNNILVIGMTNRLDLIDEAMLRPGRMEVQMEISLPNEFGRRQIVTIHTATMRKNNLLALDVEVKELAAKTKNFTGAEIEGLVRAAQSNAIIRVVKTDGSLEIDPQASDNLMVTRDDFLNALANDMKPAFGSNDQILDSFLKNGIVIWDECVQTVLDIGECRVNMLKNPAANGDILTILLEGPPDSGKTALAAQICRNSGFPFIKVCSSMQMIGLSESAKCVAMKKLFEDAYKSEFSCLLIDDLEILIDYAPFGPRYSIAIVNCLRLLMKNRPPNNRKLLVVCTSSELAILKEIKLCVSSKIAHVRNITTTKQLMTVLLNQNIFSEEDMAAIGKALTNKLCIGIKQLLLLCKPCGIEQKDLVGWFLENLERDDHVTLEVSHRTTPPQSPF